MRHLAPVAPPDFVLDPTLLEVSLGPPGGDVGLQKKDLRSRALNDGAPCPVI
jgi:hypothetical protein